MTKRIFLHTLSEPEFVWLSFFREFFAGQENLYASEETRAPLPNRFLYERNVDPQNRRFQIDLAYDFDDEKVNSLPALVLEDTGAQQLGLTIDQRSDFRVSPSRTITRADQIRHTYVFHCLSKNRGESRLLASTLTAAITTFRNAILAMPGMVKIEPWSTGATQDLKNDGGETYVDTPVQVSFTMMGHWSVVERGTGTLGSLDLIFADEDRSRFVRGHVHVQDPVVHRFVYGSVNVARPISDRFLRASLQSVAPVVTNRFMRASMVATDPISTQCFVRASVRVS